MVKSTQPESDGQGKLKVALIVMIALVVVAGGGWFLWQKVRLARYISDLDSNTDDVRIEARDRIREYGESAIPSVRGALKSKQGIGLATAALLAGKLQDQESVPRLIELLSDSDGTVRQCAAIALGGLKAGKAAEPLANCLSDSEAPVRRNAALALGMLGEDGKPGVPQMMKLLSDKKEPRDVKRACAIALGEIGDTAAVDTLVKAITPRDINLVSAIAKALGKMRSKKAVGPLCSFLKRGIPEEKSKKYGAENSPPKIRVAIINALVEIGDRKAVPALKTCADDKKTASIIVREAATKALQKIGE